MSETPFDESIMNSLAGFEGVWRRVKGEAPPFSEDDALKGFIGDELRGAVFYASLARMFQSAARATLLNHASNAKRHGRRLRAEYFIRTGVSYAPSDGGPSVSGKLASLRAALEREKRLADAYEQAAAQTACPELKELYLAFASDSRSHAQADRALLIDCF